MMYLDEMLNAVETAVDPEESLILMEELCWAIKK